MVFSLKYVLCHSRKNNIAACHLHVIFDLWYKLKNLTLHLFLWCKILSLFFFFRLSFFSYKDPFTLVFNQNSTGRQRLTTKVQGKEHWILVYIYLQYLFLKCAWFNTACHLMTTLMTKYFMQALDETAMDYDISKWSKMCMATQIWIHMTGMHIRCMLAKKVIWC